MVDRGIDVVAFRDVGLERRCLPAQRLHLFRNRAHLPVVDVHDCDMRAVLGQPERDGAADALARAGYEDNCSLDAHDLSPPRLPIASRDRFQTHRSEEHTSELQSLMCQSKAAFWLTYITTKQECIT